MNRVNPLYMIAFLILILVFTFFQVSTAKKEFTEIKVFYKETLELSHKLQSLDSIYSDKVTIKKALNRILKQQTLRSVQIKKTVSSSSLVLSSQTMSKIGLNSLMSKIVNGSYYLSSFEIKKGKDNNVAFSLEIKW